MSELYDWAKTSSAISVGQIPDWMLEGYRTKRQGQGEPRRHLIHDPNLESRGDYHKNGEVAFADVFEQPDRVNIGYLSTAPELRGQGHGSAIMQHVYDSYPDKKIVWGERMHDAADAMYEKYKTNPRTASADLAQNWVYFRHKDWPLDQGRLATGVQPHHILIHKTHDGELDGEPILGQLGNSWVSDKGMEKGHEHDIARGTYDKKGRPQIWETNFDRNEAYEQALKGSQKTAARAEQNTYALMSRQSPGDDAPWNIDSTHATEDEARAAKSHEAQRLVMFPRGEEVHPHGYYQRVGGIMEDMQRMKDEAAKFNGQRVYMPSLVWVDDTGRAIECPNLPQTYDLNEAIASIRQAQPPQPGRVPFAYIDSYIQGGDPVATHQREHIVGQKPRVYRGSYTPTESVEEMYAKIQGMGWKVKSEGPKGDHYAVTIQNPQGGQNVRTGDTRELAYTSALTWAWQHSHFSKESMDEAGRYQIIGADGDIVNDAAPDEWHAIEWAKDIARTAEPDQYNSFEVFDTVENKSIAHFRTDEHGTQPGEWVPPYNPYSSSRSNMDLPIPQKKTLGQVFASLRPSQADGNHLGIQAHTLGYTKAELETFLEAQEDAGTPRGWKTFKEAAFVAYSSRGWKVEAALTLEVYPLQGDLIRSTVQDQDVEQVKKEYSQQFNNGEIHRARLVDSMSGRTSWDTDDEWRENAPKPDSEKWEQGQVIPIEQDWAFTRASAEETKPDFTFVYYQGVLEVDEKDNARPRQLLERILDIAGKDVADENVDDKDMASGDITKRDGEIDVELTNLANEDVQTAALDSVHEWAKGMNLIGPIQPHAQV